MFQDLDNALRNLLADPQAPPPVRNALASFITPDKTFNPAQPPISRFLHELRENRVLRDPTPILKKVGAGFERQRPPVRVDCVYLVTTWINGAGAVKVRDEHQLLALTLAWLERFGAIPDQYLQNSLAGQLY